MAWRAWTSGEETGEPDHRPVPVGVSNPRAKDGPTAARTVPMHAPLSHTSGVFVVSGRRQTIAPRRSTIAKRNEPVVPGMPRAVLPPGKLMRKLDDKDFVPQWTAGHFGILLYSQQTIL